MLRNSIVAIAIIAAVAGVIANAATAHGPGNQYGGYGMMGPGMMGQGYGMGPGMMGQGYGMGPGMMGQGYGMGPGMMGPGYGMGPGMMGPGYGMGPGMMGPGYGMGPGMMGQGYGMGPGMTGPGYGMWGRSNASLTTDDVRANMERWLAVQGNPRLKVGDVKEEGEDTIVAEIVTKEGNAVVERLQIDRSTGAMRRIE